MSTPLVCARPVVHQSLKCAKSGVAPSLMRCIAQRRYVSRNHIKRMKESDAEWEQRKNSVQDGDAKSVLERLEERGLVNQIVGNRDELNHVLTENRVGVYCGVDPTAASLHIGHMVPFMALGWMYVHGYNSTFLMGGFTATIGDPTDRLTARDAVKGSVRRKNASQMFEQLKRLGAAIERYAERRGMHREWAWRRSVKNNNEWWSRMTAMEFLQSLGTATRIGPLLGRDSVKNRLEKGDGMSFAEFSYPLVQAWDWWHMFQDGVQIQIGGADQFGNILAGADSVKALRARDASFMPKYRLEWKGRQSTGDPMGFTVPLLTTSSGEKFGKSAGNAIWIDPDLTSSFDLYQFFLRSADDDVERYLKMLTFLPLEDIQQIMEQHSVDPSKRIAQRKLGDEFVELVHGMGAAQKAREQHEQMYSTNLSLHDIKAQAAAAATSKIDAIPEADRSIAVPANANLSHITLPRSLVWEQNLSRILYHSSLSASRSEGQRQISAGGVYVAASTGSNDKIQAIDDGNQVNWVAVKDPSWSAIKPMLLDESLLVLRVGKWKRKYITIISDEEYKASGQTCPGWDIHEEQGQEVLQ